MKRIEVVRKKETVVEKGPKVPQKQKVIVLRKVRQGENYEKKEEIPVSIGIPQYYRDLQIVGEESRKKKEEFAHKVVVFLIGGPGCGKGTQSERIIKAFGAGYMSAGELLRAEVAKGTELGVSLDAQMREGKIIPQEIVIQLIKDEIRRQEGDLFLIDGFPRKMDQCTNFEENIVPARCALFLDVPDDVLTERLLKRAETSGRADDNEETIKKRLETFHQVSEPVLAYYKEKGNAIVVDGNRDPDEVYKDVRARLEEFIGPAKEEPAQKEEEEEEKESQEEAE